MFIHLKTMIELSAYSMSGFLKREMQELLSLVRESLGSLRSGRESQDIAHKNTSISNQSNHVKWNKISATDNVERQGDRKRSDREEKEWIN